MSAAQSEPTDFRALIAIPQSIAEGNIDVTRGLYHFAVRRNQFEPIDGFRDRHLAHLIILVADHRPKMSFVGQLNGFHAETRSQNSV